MLATIVCAAVVTPLLSAAAAAGLLAFVSLIALHREPLRRALLRPVDPRPLALFRVAFAALLLLSLIEIAPLNTYLYSDEGMLQSAAVPQLFGRAALVGYGDGASEPAGFLDLRGALEFVVSGRWSLLYFWDSPAFVRGYFVALAAACVGLALGWRARACAAIVWLLYAGMLRRNDAHWGGEQLFCSVLFLLMLSRCGAAFSLDRWRARRRSRVAAREYPAIPAWPQMLIAGQLALCYTANGWWKSGPLWRGGDALWHALHLDRYTRLDWHAETLALGTWPLKLVSWSVLWWERLFPLLLVALSARALVAINAELNSKITTKINTKLSPSSARARALSRLCWLSLAGALAVWAALGLPAGPNHVTRARLLGALALALVAIALAPPGAAARWLTRWLPGPRLWLGFGLLFHAANFTLLNVGAFALATTTPYLLCGAGPWALALLRRCGVETGRVVDAPARRDDAVPAIPAVELLAAGVALTLAAAVALSPGRTRPLWWWHGAWLLVSLGLLLRGWRRARRHHAARPSPTSTDELRWAHGPAGRLAAGLFVAYHAVALAAWQVPAWPSTPWRDGARALVEPWLELSFTRQTWWMFTPDPPRVNAALRTVVVDQDGVEHDLETELNLPDNLTRPYLWHDRGRKINEAVVGHRRWIGRWHAGYHCRRWALEHDGAPPRAVVLHHLEAPMPPRAPLDAAAFFWSKVQERGTLTARCDEFAYAQLDDEVLTRHGLTRRGPALQTRWKGARPRTWSERQQELDPLRPLWFGLALALAGLALAWRREERARAAQGDDSGGGH